MNILAAGNGHRQGWTDACSRRNCDELDAEIVPPAPSASPVGEWEQRSVQLRRTTAGLSLYAQANQCMCGGLVQAVDRRRPFHRNDFEEWGRWRVKVTRTAYYSIWLYYNRWAAEFFWRITGSGSTLDHSQCVTENDDRSRC